MQTLHELEDWFHGKINRMEAERRLLQSGVLDGKFLVRERDDRSFTLSLCFRGLVKHYKIDVLSSGEVGIQDGPRFDNLISLISHYSVFSDGLWCCLEFPCVNSNGDIRMEAGNSRDFNWSVQQSGSNSNMHADFFENQSMIQPSTIISPIAANRNGSCGLVSGQQNGHLQNGAGKNSSKSKSSENLSKGSSSKSVVSSWLKNPVAFLSRNGHESKSTVKLNGIKPLKEEKKGPPQKMPSECLQAKPVLPPVAKNLYLSPLTILPNISEVPVPAVTPAKTIKIPLRPPPLRVQDYNHNDCKVESPTDIQNCSPLSPQKATPPSSLDIVVDKFATVVLTEAVPMAAVSCSSPDSPQALPLPSTKMKPMPFPRRKKSSQSYANLTSNQQCDSANETKSIDNSVKLESPTGATEPNLDIGSGRNSGTSSPQTPTEKLLPSSFQSMCHNLEISMPEVPKEPDLAVNVPAEDTPRVGPVPSKRPNMWPPSITTSNLNSVIAELKHRVMSVGVSDLKSPSSEMSSVFHVPSVASNTSDVKLDSELRRPSVDAKLSNENVTANSVVLRQQPLRKLPSCHETTSMTDPQYEEIDPDYEGNKSVPSSTTSENNNTIAETSDELPKDTDESLVNSTVEDSKWDDTSEEILAPSSQSSLVRGGHRKPPWTKEESEFHFKTIKRHRNGLIAIDRKLLCFQEKLGSGNFGEVLKATFTSGNDEVPCALKTLRRDHVASGKADILREARMMTRLDHPHIVRLFGISEGDPFVLVMELAPLGPLRSYLKKNPNFPINSIIGLMHQVALGMEYLESKQFVHRDLAARNVLLVNENFAKISDFGMSKALGLHSDYYTVEPKGKLPLKWYAPECIYYFKFSTKSDVWSYGVTLWEAMSYGGKPYVGLTGREILKMFSTNQRLHCPDKCPKDIFRIMQHCWELRPETRPSFSQLVMMLKSKLDT